MQAETGTSELVARLAAAHVWGFPLVAVHRTRAAHGSQAVGRLVARDRLAGAADRTVVAPNNDTLYASGWFDLADGDLLVEVPPVERYWSVMLLDAYTHVRYACRRLHGTQGARVRVTHDPDAAEDQDPSNDTIAIGTRTLWVLVRVLVDGPDDLPEARSALGSIRVHQDGQHHGEPTPPGPGDGAPTDGWFGELRTALELDPPVGWQPAPPPDLVALLGELPSPEVQDAARSEGRARILSSLGVDREQHGWGTRSRGAAFGDDAAYRAAFAMVSLAGHLPEENRSYRRAHDGTRPARLRLPPSAAPPVSGFWSLTVYGEDLFFAENPLGRHSVGGHTPGVRKADGSHSITLSPDPPADLDDWLPTPAGPCWLVFRAYEGEQPVVDATWFPPDLERTP